MKFHEQNIEAFIQLLKSQRSLFSAQDRASLDKLIAKLPDDEEKISEAIASWYEQRPKILDAQLDILNTLLTNELHASRTIGTPNTDDDKDYRKNLIDAIGLSTG
ncbi:MAG: hypothetical protein LDL41_22185 [Coleofasciculus sp. S288]|nr:hypothetical protein [Coleofasciculus sp. S288]